MPHGYLYGLLHAFRIAMGFAVIIGALSKVAEAAQIGIAKGGTNHFTCQSCQSGKGHRVDHTWGKGSHHLVSLDLNSSGCHPVYSSKDLAKVEDGTACE